MLLWHPEETTHPPCVTLRNNKIPELLPNGIVFIYDAGKPSYEMDVVTLTLTLIQRVLHLSPPFTPTTPYQQ